MKKQLFIMLALMLIISVNSIAQTFSYNGINYGVVDSSYNSKVYVVGGNGGISGDISIPDIVIDTASNTQYQVVGIDDYAFQNCIDLDSMNISNNITYIGINCFDNCINLEYIHLPNNLDTIREGTFINGQSLNNINIGSNIKYIGNAAFTQCLALTAIRIPATGTIVDTAFMDCINLDTVIFYAPPSNTKNGDILTLNCGAFNNCISLSNIYCKTSTPPIIKDGAFYGVNILSVKLHVCDTNTYSNSDWSSFNIQYDSTICHNSGLSDIENDINLSVYPNPTIDYIDIMVNNNDKSLAYFYDINGKKIKSFSFRGYYRLDTSDLNNGIYLLKIGNATKKIVK